MTTLARLVVAMIVVLAVAGFAEAQQSGHEHGAAQAGSAGQGAAAPESKADHAQMMAMCRRMMHDSPSASGPTGPRRGMMGGGDMMGMMPMTGDPKRDAEMMAMRGEIMKAVGDIMVKYAQRMQPAK